MPNIVVSMYNYVFDTKNEHALPPFYEAFICGLKAHGNNVMCYHHDDIGQQFDEAIPEEILDQLMKFNPDLFIFFNNNFWDITSYFDVPILIYDVDSPNLYTNKIGLKSKIERYSFLVNQSNGCDLIKTLYSVPNNRVCYIAPFTEVQAKPAEIGTNIVFCGSHWLWSGCDFVYDYMKSQPSREDRLMAQNILQLFKQDPFKPYYQLYEDLGYHSINKIKYDARMASGRLSGIKRARYLTEICDLGLEVRGNFWNHPSLNLFPELALCYNCDEVTSIQTTQDMYNSTKIGFNVNHIQAKTGFSWRVCDIMASNACLISEYTPDIARILGNVDLPLYNSITQAREQCIRVLNDEEYRMRIVERSHEIINENHRFANALYDIEKFLDMKLRESNCIGMLEMKKLTPKKKPLPITQRLEKKIWNYLGRRLKKQGII